ncbi:MAG TPA: hypothetical protein VMT16_00190, partial [Thermoanaerobaculia bacterium]|nr:hypothetical protein [Thermoanaerobaculia bacterium]
GAASGVEETAITAAAVPQGAARWLPWVVAGAVALAAALVLVRGLAAPQHAVEGPLRFELALPKGAHLALDHQHDMMAISADGRRQVFLVRGEDGVRALALRDLGQATARMLPGTAGASTPAFSPDGEWVAFVAGNRLWKVPVAGGAPVVVAEPVADPRGLAWSPDGHLYLAPDFAASLRRVGDGGGSLEPVTELDAGRQERTHRWPHALPGGGVVLFTSDTVDSTEFYDDARIEALRVATGERTVVVEQASRARYVSGHLVFARGGSLYAAPFDAEALRVTGPPAIVLQGVSTTVASGAAHFAVSEEGSLFYVPGEVAAQAASVPLWLDREGGQEASTIAAANYDQLALSPDGRRVALVLQQGGSNGLWVADLQRGTLTRLTFAGSVADPVWSPDGLSIAYGGADGVYRQPSDGSGEPERLWGPRSGVFPSSFSPDGSVLIVEYGVDQGQGDLGVLDLGAPEEPTPVVQGPAHEWMGEVSPDGRWLAYVSVESGRPEVYVRPVQGRGGKWQVSVESGFEPRWSPEGGELFYRSGVGDLFAVPLAPGETFAPGPPTRLLSGMRSGDNARTYSVGPDGSRFLTLGLTVDGHVDRLNLVLGWDGEVARIAKRHGSR